VHTVSGSAVWYERSSDGQIICANCVRKYNSGVGAVAVVPEGTGGEPPPFMFRPVKEEQDWKHVGLRVIMYHIEQ